MGIADLGSSQPSHPARSGTRRESVTVTVSGSYVRSCTFSRCHTHKRRFGLSSWPLNSGPTETISMRQSSSMVFRDVAQNRESAAWKDTGRNYGVHLRMRECCSDSERFISTCKDLQEHGRHPKSLQDSRRHRYCVPRCVPRSSVETAQGLQANSTT